MKIDFLAPNPAERNATLREIGPRANLRTTEKISAKGPDADLVWLHGDTEDRLGWQLDSAQAESLRRYVENGGRVLLTGPAACLVAPIAGEPKPPIVRRTVEPQVDLEAEEADLPSAARGAMPMPGHPLFHRAIGGRMFYERLPGEEYAEAVYEAGERPLQGDVVAVEKLESGCQIERPVIIEYKVGRGRVVSVGAPLSFIDRAGDSALTDQDSDPLLESRARFVGDLLDYTMNDHAAERGAPWRSQDTGAWIRWDSSKLLTQPEPVPAPEDRGVEAVPGEPVEFELSHDDGHVIYGDTSSESFEVWRQPFRAFRNFSYSFLVGEAGWVTAKSVLADSRVHLDRVVQRFKGGAAGSEVDVECTVATAPGGFQVRWQNCGDRPMRLRVEGVASLGLASPYPASSLGDLDLVSSAKGAELKVADPVLGYGAWMRFDRIPKRSSLADHSTDEETQIRFEREFKLPKNGDLAMELGGLVRDSFAVGGRPVSSGEPQPTLPLPLRVTVGDDAFEEALTGLRSRAVAALRSYDGQSRGLTAGRLTIGLDLDTGGYFVGRGCLALATSQLQWGLGGAVRDHLYLLQRFQAAAGQIFDQLTVSGVLRTGDTDSTAEFVQLVGSYLAWTGDHETVFELWPAVRRALSWLETELASELDATDPDTADLDTAQPDISTVPYSTVPCPVKAFRVGARLARLVGESDAAEAYAAMAEAKITWEARPSVAEVDLRSEDSESDAVAAQSNPQTTWDEVAERVRRAWSESKPWERVAQSESLRLVVEGVLGLQIDEDDGVLVLQPSLEGGPAVVTFDNLAIQGRSWSGELRRDSDGMDLSVHQEGPAIEIACKSVEDCEGPDDICKITFEADTVVRFSITPPN